ncbi:MAG: hypothetical protein WC223_11785 [Bacteroidales bacterium]|jgi:hypothetical protein
MKLNIIKVRYKILICFIVIAIIGFFLTYFLIKYQIGKLKVDSNSVTIKITMFYLYTTYIFFKYFGLYILTLVILSTTGFIISKKYYNREFQIGFKIISIITWTIILLFIGFSILNSFI